MTIVEQIRAEVERLMRENSSSSGLEGGVLGLTYEDGIDTALNNVLEILSILSDLEKEEKPSEGEEIDIEKFIEKMDAWKARFSRPDDIPIKATMAFTARMFYMYPKVARKWYESLPKAIQD